MFCLFMATVYVNWILEILVHLISHVKGMKENVLFLHLTMGYVSHNLQAEVVLLVLLAILSASVGKMK